MKSQAAGLWKEKVAESRRRNGYDDEHTLTNNIKPIMITFKNLRCLPFCLRARVSHTHTHADTHSAEGLVVDRGQPLPWREGGEEGGEEKLETALSFTESGGVIRGDV